jgi:hypothetical protein
LFAVIADAGNQVSGLLLRKAMLLSKLTDFIVLIS